MYTEAANFIKSVIGDGGTVLFVGTKRSAREAMQKEAVALRQPFVNQRWLGGMLTNFKTIRQSIKRLAEITELAASGALDKRGKKEATQLRREMDKLESSLGGIKDMDSLPDALFVIDVGHENIAIHEAKKLGIPVVAIVDTNCSPDGIDYVIPGNDDAMRAIHLYTAGIADAVLEGKESVPQMGAVGEDEFVELDEAGNPRKKSTRGRPQRPQAAACARNGSPGPPPRPSHRNPGCRRARGCRGCDPGCRGRPAVVEPHSRTTSFRRSWRSPPAPCRRQPAVRSARPPAPAPDDARDATDTPRIQEFSHDHHSRCSQAAPRAHRRGHDGVQEGTGRDQG